MNTNRALLFFGAAILSFAGMIAEASARGCPAGYTQEGNRCVKYSCRPGCTYIGGGKCRCRR